MGVHGTRRLRTAGLDIAEIFLRLQNPRFITSFTTERRGHTSNIIT